MAALVSASLACGGDGVASPATATAPAPPTATAAPSPTPTVAPEPAATAALTPTVTPAPAPTATATPAPAPTSAPPPRLTSTPAPQPRSAADRAGLWAGDIQIADSGEQPGIPWLALRLVPGEDPDADPWRLLGGPLPPPPPESQCLPEPRDDGWRLTNCVGWQGTLFVPAEGDSGLEVSYRAGPTEFHATLSRIPRRDEPRASSNVTMLWHEPGEGIHSDVWAADGLVFAPHYSDGSIEIRDASTGELLGVAAVPGDGGLTFDVKARAGLLYAATVPDGLVIFDVSEPAEPELVGQYQVFGEQGSPDSFFNIHNIFLSPDGSMVYAINHSTYPRSDLRIIDVSDPASPKEAGRFTLETDTDERNSHFTHDVNVIERNGRLIAFLNYIEAGLRVLDVTDPAAVSVLGSIAWDGIFSHSGWPFELGDRLYYAHTSEGYDRHLTVLDVTDLTSPQVVSRFGTRPGLSIHNVQVVDGIAYISYYVDGLRVVDLRDPENPREIAHYDTVPDDDERGILQGAWGVRVLDGVVYISDLETGTYALRVDLE